MSAVEETDGCFIQFGSWKPKSVVFEPITFRRDGIVFKFGDQGPDHSKQLEIKLDARDILKCEYNLQRVLPTIFIYTTSFFGRKVRQKLKLVKGSSDSMYFNPLSHTESEKRVIIQPLHPCDDSRQQRFIDVFNAMAAYTKRLTSDVFKELQLEAINALLIMISKSKVSTASSSSFDSDDDDDFCVVPKKSKSSADSPDGRTDKRTDGMFDDTSRSSDDGEDDHDHSDVVEESESSADIRYARTYYGMFGDTSRSSDEDSCSETSDGDSLTVSTGVLPVSLDEDSLSGTSDVAVAGSSSSSSSSSDEESDGRLKTIKRPVASSDESDSSLETVVVKRALSSDDESELSFETRGMKRAEVTADKCKKRKIDGKKKNISTGAKDCKYYQQCIQVQEAIGLPEALLDLDSEYNRCYCQKCHDERGEADHYRDGPGPNNLYTKPIGWGRIMLKLPPRASHLSIFQNWNVAYHGTSVKNLIQIVEGGDLLIPGDKTMHGEIIEEVTGHFNDYRKPRGFNTKQVFLSPSIKYAGCDVYAKKRMLRLYNDTVEKSRFVNVRTVLQVRIKPDQYRVGRQTIGRTTRIDPPISNTTIEWSTEARNAVIPTAVLIQVTESIAPEQSSSICPTCRVLLTGVNHPATRTCKHQHVICKKCDDRYHTLYGDTCVLCSLPTSFQLKASKVKEIRRSAKAFRVAGKKARRKDKYMYDLTVFVTPPTGDTEAIQSCPSSTIEELKGEIEARVSMPVAQQRLIFAGKMLEDGRTLSDYNITNNCVVQLVQRLCGN